MLAVAGGHVDAVSLLLERDASVNLASHHGLTALHLGVSTAPTPPPRPLSVAPPEPSEALAASQCTCAHRGRFSFQNKIANNIILNMN